MAISDVTITFYAEAYEDIEPTVAANGAMLLNRVSQAKEKLRDSASDRVNELRRILVHEFRVLMSAEK